MPDSTQARFDAVIDLSKTLLKSALAGDWERVIALESQRDALIKALFQPPLTLAPEILAEKTYVILEINQLLIEHGQRHRDELQQERIKLLHAANAMRFYRE